MKYLFDNKVISIFIGKPEDSEEVASFTATLIARFGELFNKVAEKYLLSQTNLSKVEINKLINFIEDNEIEIGEDIVSNLTLLETKDFQDLYQSKLDEYSAQVYSKFAANLSDMQKKELAQYIKEVEVQNNQEIQETKISIDSVLSDMKSGNNTENQPDAPMDFDLPEVTISNEPESSNQPINETQSEPAVQTAVEPVGNLQQDPNSDIQTNSNIMPHISVPESVESASGVPENSVSPDNSHQNLAQELDVSAANEAPVQPTKGTFDINQNPAANSAAPGGDQSSSESDLGVNQTESVEQVVNNSGTSNIAGPVDTAQGNISSPSSPDAAASSSAV